LVQLWCEAVSIRLAAIEISICVRKRSNRQGIVYRRTGLAPRRVPVLLIADRQPFATSIDCP
jgi:hypothetical protein